MKYIPSFIDIRSLEL